MKLRLIKQNNKLLLLCPNGSIKVADNALIGELLTSFSSPGKFKGKDGCWKTVESQMERISGHTIAEVDDQGRLIIYSGKEFSKVVAYTEYISATEFAEMHDKCRASVKNMCAEGRIEGAYKNGAGWQIPKNAPYPERKSRAKANGK